MMFETLILLAAATAQSAPEAVGCQQPAIEAAPTADAAIIEMTYNAFVAVEETPGVSELARPAIVFAPNRQSAFAAPIGTAWIN